jgi:membrane-bound ClpP family serine protease
MLRKVLAGAMVIVAVMGCICTCSADTFKHKTSGQILHGYAEQDPNNGKTAVYTPESGKQLMNLAEYEITLDEQGRNRFVTVFTFDEPIEYEIVTAAFEKALVEESNKGPLFIIIEIDCPGGRVDLATRMCAAITKTRNCQTIAFIKGGSEGGAFSAAAAMALACNKIYMAGATVIGAATVITRNENGAADLETVAGKNVSEKMRSAWRNYMASLAEQNHRPVALVRAMENKDIEVLEVRRNGKIQYIENTEKKMTDDVIRIRKPKGQIVTLPAGEAVECGVADKVVNNLQDILATCNASDANVVRPDQLALAKEELDKVIRKFEKLKNSLEVKFHTLSAKSRNSGISVSQAKKSFKSIIQEMKYLMKLKKTYPDVPCEEEDIQEIINVIQAEHDSL